MKKAGPLREVKDEELTVNDMIMPSTLMETEGGMSEMMKRSVSC